MLSQREKEGLKAILEKLDSYALISLTGTITKGMIKPETRDEAMTIILKYTEKAFTLLHRKKIKKEILFHYLKDNGVSFPPSGEKATFVMACLKLWESNVDEENITEMEDLEELNETSYPLSETFTNEGDNFLAASVSVGQQLTTQDVTWQQQVVTEKTYMISDLEQMGKEFAAWFYGLLNKVHLEPENFHSDHFWPDCILQLQISLTDTQLQALNDRNITFHMKQICDKSYSEQVIGGKNVTETLLKLVFNHKLLFHPNANHYGVSCSIERHGLVRIFVSGVLHKENTCIGLFDQTFGLIRSVNGEDNWKIKNTDLLLKVKKANSISGISLA